MMSESEILLYFVYLYISFIFMVSIVYMYTMYTQYKNAHDKWYDINRESNLSPRKEIKQK